MISLPQREFPLLPPSRARLSARLVPFKTLVFSLRLSNPIVIVAKIPPPLYPHFQARVDTYRKSPDSSAMSLLRRVDIMDPFFCPPSSFVAETSVFAPGGFPFPPLLEVPDDVCLALDLLTPPPNPSPFDLLEDLVQIERTPCFSSYRRVLQRVRPEAYYLQSLCDRVSALESRFDRLVSARGGAAADREYTWTAEIEGKEVDRKYKWTAEIKSGKKKKEKEKEKEKHHYLHHHLLQPRGGSKSYKWTAEIKEKDEEGYTRTYTWKSSTGGGDDSEAKPHKDKKEKKKKEEKKKDDKCATRVVEIEEPSHGAVLLRQVRRVTFELSLQLLTLHRFKSS